MSTFHNDNVVVHKKTHAFVIVFDVSNASGPHLPNRKIAQTRRVFFEELNGKGAYCLNDSTEIKLNA